MTERIAGKLGRIPAPLPKKIKRLGDYLCSPFPPPPRQEDHTQGVKSWGMLGNDTYGDCTIAGLVHLRMADAVYAAEKETWPSTAKVVQAYLKLTGGQDDGLVLSSVLKSWQRSGILGDKVVGYAPLSTLSATEVAQVIHAFVGVYAGVRIPAPAMDQFNAGQPWDLTGTAADRQIEGGHCIPILGQDAKYAYAVTWGHVQKITWRWWRTYIDEGWAVVTSELQKASPGLVNLPLLLADLKKL